MEIPEIMNVWADWGEYTTGPAKYESLAEECTELAQAALKMARLIRNENPTPVTKPDTEAKLQEEFTDVISCAISLNLEVNAKLSVEKFDRMKKRCQQMVNPAVNFVPMVRGEWIKDEGSYYVDGYVGYYDFQCSVCGEMVTDRHGLPRYCPWCGAKM